MAKENLNTGFNLRLVYHPVLSLSSLLKTYLSLKDNLKKLGSIVFFCISMLGDFRSENTEFQRGILETSRT